jgi:hypothetical protein
MVIFFWVFGAEKAWDEITRGAHIKIPRFFFYLMKYVTPIFLIIILAAWGYQYLSQVLGKGGFGVWVARAYLIALFLLHIVIVRVAWKRRSS